LVTEKVEKCSKTTVVFITTCSQNKVGWGRSYGTWPNCERVPDRLLSARNSLYETLRQHELQKLRGAVLGPDFIRDSNQDGAYLPACTRYARGQFMTSLELAFKEDLRLWLDENTLFFITGLYGIVYSCEPIQNYDVELEGLAGEYWQRKRSLLTDCLRGFLERGSILLDCCGEPRYSDLIDWQDIEKQGFQVFHAIDPLRKGGQVRAEAGSLAANINGTILEQIKNGSEFPGVNAVIKFVGNTEFSQPRTGASGHLPRVGVIETDRGDEFSKVTKEAERQGWNRHFNFEKISTPEELKKAYQDRVEQCICLIPEEHHDYLVKWGKGKEPRAIYGHELLKVRRPIDLVLWFKDLNRK
jgi:hypothetical protein